LILAVVWTSSAKNTARQNKALAPGNRLFKLDARSLHCAVRSHEVNAAHKLTEKRRHTQDAFFYGFIFLLRKFYYDSCGFVIRVTGAVLKLRRKNLFDVLLILLLAFAASATEASGCDLDLPVNQSEGIAQVKISGVIDGDTVRLQNNKLVRFIGINTPEIDHEHGRSAPLAETAREFLQTLIDRQQGSILMQYDREAEDRHGRQLAHVFTMEGQNIQALLIARGLGVWITVPPNLQYLDCYRQQEQKARQQRLGVWAAQFEAPHDTALLTRRDRGFVWLRGKVTRIGHGKKFVWLNFGKGNGKGEAVAVQVHKDDLHYFSDPTFATLKNKTVTIKGWLFPYKKQLVMRLRHPASLEVLD